MFLEVTDNLFLSDKNTLKDISEVDKHGVSLVVSVAGGRLQLPAGVEHVKLHVKDDNKDSLLHQLDEVVQLIHHHVSRGDKVVVHCQAGLSRSPAVIMAYLVRFRRLTVEEALAEVRKVRPRARPRERLLEDLQKYFEICLAERGNG